MANNFNFAEEKILEENSPEEEMVDELLVEDLPEPEREGGGNKGEEKEDWEPDS